MSKKLNTQTDDFETTELKAESIPEKIEIAKTEVEDKLKGVVGIETMAKKPSRMGVVRYLQLYPQKNYVEVILRKFYASEVHEKEEWDLIVEEVSTRKITS